MQRLYKAPLTDQVTQPRTEGAPRQSTLQLLAHESVQRDAAHVHRKCTTQSSMPGGSRRTGGSLKRLHSIISSRNPDNHCLACSSITGRNLLPRPSEMGTKQVQKVPESSVRGAKTLLI